MKKLVALLATVAMMILTTGIAQADNVKSQVNVGGGVAQNRLVPLDQTTTMLYYVEKTGADCDPATGAAATLTFAHSPLVVASSPTVTVAGCGAENGKTVDFSSATSGKYPITVSVSDPGSSDSYSTSPAVFNLVVNNPPAISVTGVTNGAEYTLGSVPVAGCTVTDPEEPNAIATPVLTGSLTGGLGSQTATCRFEDEAGQKVSASVTYIIKAAPSSVSTTTTVSCPATVTFTGSPLEPCSASVEATSLSQPVAVTYDLNTDAGTATATATFAGTSGFQGSTDSKTFTIAKAVSTTTVTCTGAPFTYSGSAQTPCSATVIGPGGLDQPAAVTYSDNTNAGTATASASYAEGANHLASNGSKTFTIAKAATTTTVTCTGAPFTYSGSAQTPCSATVIGPGGLDQRVDVTYSDNTNAGTATASASYAEGANHTASTDSEKFTIDKAASTTTVTCTAGPFTYDGTAQTPCSATVIGPGGLDQLADVTYSNNTNAGTAAASASYAEGANHTASTDSETFTIAKATSTTTVSCPSTAVIYTGSALTPCFASVTGPGGLKVPASVSYSNNIQVGTASATAAYVGADNYLPSDDSDSFEIVCPVSGEFQAPIKDGFRNIVKHGNVIPVKIVLRDCVGALTTANQLEVRVREGIAEAGDTDDGTAAIPVSSVSSADTSNFMRVSDGHYMYNLATKPFTIGRTYSIIVKDASAKNYNWATASRAATAVIEPKK